jgi:predicted anti-sigma-YlaC factor YlaD
MNCEAVREHLTEHLLGHLGEGEEGEVRRHLRGCAACRGELRAMEEGMRTFALAAHQVSPPEGLRDRVLRVLEDERIDAPPARRWLSARVVAAAAAVVVVAGSLSWATVASGRAANAEAEAGKYEAFLGALGGKDVRVGTLHARDTQPIEGSVVMYDSTVGQSWVLVLVRAPGIEGRAHAVVSSPSRKIELFPLKFDAGGEASTWLVTGADITSFHRVAIYDLEGRVLATASVSRL